MESKILLEVDGEEVTLDQFIQANTDDGVLLIANEDMNAVWALQIGQSCYISSHGGYTTILRIS